MLKKIKMCCGGNSNQIRASDSQLPITAGTNHTSSEPNHVSPLPSSNLGEPEKVKHVTLKDAIDEREPPTENIVSHQHGTNKSRRTTNPSLTESEKLVNHHSVGKRTSRSVIQTPETSYYIDDGKSCNTTVVSSEEFASADEGVERNNLHKKKSKVQNHKKLNNVKKG